MYDAGSGDGYGDMTGGDQGARLPGAAAHGGGLHRLQKEAIDRLFAKSLHSMVIVDINGHVVAMNRAARALFDCPPEAAGTRHFASLIGEDYLRTYLACLATAAPREDAPGNCVCAGRPVLAHRTDGRIIPVSLCITQAKIEGDLFAIAHLRPAGG